MKLMKIRFDSYRSLQKKVAVRFAASDSEVARQLLSSNLLGQLKGLAKDAIFYGRPSEEGVDKLYLTIRNNVTDVMDSPRVKCPALREIGTLVDHIFAHLKPFIIKS